VSLILFVLLALLVANLRRSRTGRRLIAVRHERTSRRVARHLGVRCHALRVRRLRGTCRRRRILVGFRGQVITYTDFNVFASINSLGNAVIGGLGLRARRGLRRHRTPIGGLGSPRHPTTG